MRRCFTCSAFPPSVRPVAHAVARTPEESAGISLSPPARQLWAAVIILVVLSGLIFRWAEWASDRSLWLDEAALAQNIVEQPVSELARGRLVNHQVAPAGFMLAVRAVTAVAGSDERALRFVPFLASTIFLLSFVWLAWRRLGPPAALAAAALTAWSWPLLRYAGEFKQYSTDTLVALLLFAVAPGLLTHPLTWRRAVALAAGGVAALVFSQPAIFLLAALGTLAWVSAARQQQWPEWRRWTTVGIVWVVFLAGQLSLNYGTGLGDPLLADYHREAFLHFWPPAVFAQVLRTGVFDSWVWLTCAQAWWLWLALLVFGAWMGWQQARAETVFIALTLFWLGMASALGVYPLVGRLLLFLAPLLFWLIARGVRELARGLHGRAAPVVAVLLALPLWPMASDALTEARQPRAPEHLRPVVGQLAQLAHPGDLILVWPHTRFAFAYYWPRMAHGEVAVATAPLNPDVPEPAEQMAAKLATLTRGHERVWLVLTHFEYGEQMNNLRQLIAVLRADYPRVEEFTPRDGSARGLEFSR